MKNNTLFIMALLVGAAGLLGGLTWLNVQLVAHVDAGEFFRSPWSSARTFLLNGQNPYLTAPLQNAYMQGRPFYKLFVYFPFALVNEFELALALWLTLSEIALLGVAYLSIAIADWKPSPLNAVLFTLTLFLSFYGLFSLLGGSEIIFDTFFLLLILLALRENWDDFLGVLLVFGSFFPQKGGLIFLLVFVWLVLTRRWRVFMIAAMSLVTLYFVSFLLLPAWFSAYFETLSSAYQTGYGFLFSDLLQLWVPQYTDLLAMGIRWLALLVLLLVWFNARKGSFQHLLWTASFSLALLPFLNLHLSASVTS